MVAGALDQQSALTHLLAVAEELATARTREDIAHAMIERAAVPLGAYASAVWTRASDGVNLELLDCSPSEREAARSYRQLPLASDSPIATAVRTGEAFFLGSPERYAARFPASYERLTRLGASSHVAFAVVPCAAGDVPLGALCFTYESEREFAEAERTYLALLARHCGLALARVELLVQEREQREAAVNAAAAEKQARADVELLYELIAAFNRLDDIGEVYKLALASVQRGSRADRAAILLFDADGVMRFRASSGLSERYRAAVEGHTPWKPDDAFAAPIAIADADVDPAWESYRPVFRDEGIRALAFVPIVHQRRVVGKFMLYRNEPREFEPRDLQLTATVAVHVAQAVERKQQERELARAYREERAAHLLTEEATRAREEILSVVSHDLRNPLGTIMMGASTLLTLDAGEKSQRVRTVAERIHRQTERMARLIEDLVDFAGIQAGRLALERAPHEPLEILSTATEIFGPIASERGLRLETEVPGNLPAVECDSDRAVQVLSNLVSNALKVTPKGGQISIGASLARQPDPENPRSGEIVFFVRDTGPGIAAEELPNLFERHWRGKETAYRGTGLGLSIARGIVDAHGGRIWAESQVGAGSTFYFSLTPNN